MACESTHPSGSVEGTWEGQLTLNTPSDSIALRLTQSESILNGNGFLRVGYQSPSTGPTYFTFRVAGTVSGGTVDLVISQGPVESHLRGRLVGDQIPATFEYLTVGTYPVVLHHTSTASGQ